MVNFIGTRLIEIVFTLLAVTIVVVLLVHAVPGNIVQQMLGQVGAAEEQRQALEAAFGLDRPIPVQYWDWVSGLFRGSLGTSWNRGSPVEDMLRPAFMVTLQLGLLSLGFALVFGIAGGLISSATRGRWPDAIIQGFNVLGLSLPAFWVGAMLLVTMSSYFQWGPPIRFRTFSQDSLVNLQIMLLPTISLGFFNAAAISQFVRELVSDVERQDFIRTARAKGLPDARVYFKHVFRNVLIPLTSFCGVIFIGILGGVVAIEAVFSLPGIGRLVITAIQTRDYPLVQGGVFMIAVVTMAVNLIVDLLYGIIDPRIKYA